MERSGCRVCFLCQFFLNRLYIFPSRAITQVNFLRMRIPRPTQALQNLVNSVYILRLNSNNSTPCTRERQRFSELNHVSIHNSSRLIVSHTSYCILNSSTRNRVNSTTTNFRYKTENESTIVSSILFLTLNWLFSTQQNFKIVAHHPDIFRVYMKDISLSS